MHSRRDMPESSQPESPPERFTSAKTTAAIPIRHPAIRDALIQFSLDAAVRSIEYIESATVGSEVVNVDAIVVQGEGGRSLLDIIPARPLRDLGAGIDGSWGTQYSDAGFYI